MVDKYTEQLEAKIESYEEELGKIQVYQDYADEIIDLAANGYEESRLGYKNSKKVADKNRFKGQMDAFEKMLFLVKKWLREMN